MNRVIKSRNMRWAGHLAGKGERTYRVLVGGWEAGGKRLLRRRRCKWESSINPLNAELNPICHLLALLRAHHIFHVSELRVKMYFQEMGCRGARTELIWLGIWTRWPALVKAVKNIRVPWNTANFFTSWKTVRFSRRTLFYETNYYSVIFLYIDINSMPHYRVIVHALHYLNFSFTINFYI